VNEDIKVNTKGQHNLTDALTQWPLSSAT